MDLTEDRSLELSSDGMCNLNLAAHHRQVIGALNSTWNQMENLGDFSHCSLIDVVKFLSSAQRLRRSNGQRKFSDNSLQVIRRLQCGVAKLLAQHLNAFVMNVVQTTPDLESRHIPSRKRRNSTGDGEEQLVLAADQPPARRRQVVQVDVDAIWELIQEAQETGVSLPVLARTKKNEKQGGCSEHTVKYWLGKVLSMYCARANLAFKDVRFFNLLTDSSTFSTRDTCVSALYSPERDLGCYLAAQSVKGNLIAPNELHLDASVERMVAIRKADRVASYRLMQALSNQLSQLSNRQVSIRSFKISDGATDVEHHPLATALTPLTPQHLRIVDRFPDGSFKALHVLNKRTVCFQRADKSRFVS